MIEYVRDGDIFNSECQVLVNPVNCVGVMGAGLAAAFKEKFPSNFESYKAACMNNNVRLRHMHLFHEYWKGFYIVNFPTKGHWRDKSELKDIISGLKSLRGLINACGFRSIAIPALGCGLGGLAWSDVKACIDLELGPINELEGVKIRVYEPR